MNDGAGIAAFSFPGRKDRLTAKLEFLAAMLAFLGLGLDYL